jgi:pyruvate formate lyase activating enzyme
MDIRGFIPTSLVDWDGKVVSTVFTPKCNFECSFCHNHELVKSPEKFEPVSEEKIIAHLKENADFLDGICITGGEPTLQRDLFEFCEKIKSLGFEVKLDTNGTNPTVLKKLIQKKLVDFVAMDIKAPISMKKYEKISGVKSGYLIENVEESIQTLLKSDIDYEFRTTIVPSIHTKEEVKEIARSISGCKKYVLQKFQPENAYSDSLKKERGQTDEEMDCLVKVIKKYVPNSKWRGK